MSWIYETYIGRCTDCNRLVDYIGCLENTCDFISKKDLNRLRKLTGGKIAEERERLSVFERDEKRDKAIGASSLKEMLENNKDTSRRKSKSNLPDEEELDKIL